MNEEIFKELMMRIPYGVCLVNRQGTVFKPESIHIVNRTVGYTDPDTGEAVSEELEACKMVLLPKSAFLQQIVFNGKMVCPIKLWYENFYKHSEHYQLLKEEEKNDFDITKWSFIAKEESEPTDLFMPYMLKFHIDYNHLREKGFATSAIDFVNPYC